MNIHIAEFIKCFGLLFCLGLGVTASYAAPPVVGKISFARGSNAAQQPGAAPRILGQDADIFQGDNIQTTERSFVIIAFNDGAKMTVRPNSSFTVDHYDSQSPHPQATVTLHEGGVRTSSGDIAKQTPGNFQIKTPLATVNAQQADYSVRLCQKDCEKEDNEKEDNLKQTVRVKTDQSVVARVVDIKGLVIAHNPRDKNAKERQLALGAPLYSADYLRSQDNSYALMVFRDGEKITLQANSEMEIADYRYQTPGEQDHALYRLTIGGMRALTGSIGKTNKAAYAVDTPVGTIGIRGTGFDLTCVGACANNGLPQSENVLDGLAEGLYSHVWQGQIVLKNDSGEQLITMPESGYFANRKSEVFKLPEIPQVIPDNLVPRPDHDNSSLEKLFSKQQQQGVPSGLYVTVHQGHVQLKQENVAGDHENVDLGKDEVAYVTPQKSMVRLRWGQAFQKLDPYPLPSSDSDGQHSNTGTYSVLTEDDASSDATTYECSN
ncbi:MAG: FecR domain-containing protein [Methylovulum sp.]|uniref:FecR family protein n=1 Tax=Methylovulum sp. TaxID=1916980 RepID=UPI002608B07B|nr:FecR domain-containing protein [Methylovulum sp.]MDD2725047.1 FecR domain-containing protein [Methylovulum sp.]MDD5125960.1 FecR domain-containing protein [Methylovulum sp.]